ncbi:cytochrome P450 [Rostrohypoxylon terebratum]|nr:cytochrome P450 [Rostrohypoxylon terebratum]
MAIPSWFLAQATAGAATYALVRYRPLPEGVFLSNASHVKTFFVIYSIILFGWVLYSRFVYPKWLSPLNKLPKPTGGSWWNGHFIQCFSVGTGETEAGWIQTIPNDGFIYYLHIFNTPRVIATSPKVIQELCTRADEFIKPKFILWLAEKLLGIGLVLAEGQHHRRQRRAFLPIFAPRHVREMYPIFWDKTCEVTQKLAGMVTSQSRTGESVFEVGHWASRAALDIVTMATLGADFGAIQDENSKLAKTYRLALEPTRGYLFQALLKLWFPPWLIDGIPNKWNRSLREYVPIFRGVCRDLLNKKRLEVADKTREKGKDLLSLCFHYEEVADADEEELIDQLSTFMAAGHETISVGITWAVYMMCLHPEWQELLRAEARAHFPDPTGSTDAASDKKVTSADVEQMPLMQAFINEVLRWYPPIPQTLREPLQDTVVCGQLLPKGISIVIPIKGIHRHEDAWGPDANVFNPRRWLNADGSFNSTGGAVSKYANLSFMQGVRSCVAMGFAKAEMACVLAAWVGRFEFDLVDEELRDESNMKTSNGGFSGRPKNGMFVKWKVLSGWDA